MPLTGVGFGTDDPRLKVRVLRRPGAITSDSLGPSASSLKRLALHRQIGQEQQQACPRFVVRYAENYRCFGT